MSTQTIFQVGNSNVVAIPSSLMKDMQLKKGHTVVVERTSDGDAIMIKPKRSKTPGKKLTEKEYQTWLAQFLEEDGALLDELAHR